MLMVTIAFKKYVFLMFAVIERQPQHHEQCTVSECCESSIGQLGIIGLYQFEDSPMCNRMISIICGPVFIIAASGAAFAAPPSPVYNWTGWYVGVNAGASFGNVKTDLNVSPLTVGGTVNHFTFPGFAGSDREYPSGFMGGGQVGYNWQYSPLIVVGLEADIQGALERDTANLNNPFSGTFPALSNATGLPVGPTTKATGTVATNYTTQIDWFGTVRGRIGYVWGNGEVLTYVTAGLAYGEVKLNGTNVSSVGSLVVGSTLAQTFGHSQINTGWVVGYGTEGRLGATNWTWKVEGLYVDLGTLDTAGVTSGITLAGAGTTSATGAQVSTHSHFTDGILRGGLNYKFY